MGTRSRRSSSLSSTESTPAPPPGFRNDDSLDARLRSAPLHNRPGSTQSAELSRPSAAPMPAPSAATAAGPPPSAASATCIPRDEDLGNLVDEALKRIKTGKSYKKYLQLGQIAKEASKSKKFEFKKGDKTKLITFLENIKSECPQNWENVKTRLRNCRRRRRLSAGTLEEHTWKRRRLIMERLVRAEREM